MSNEAFSLQSSLLMWALGAAIVWMAAHVMLGWMRQAQEAWDWDFSRLGHVLIGAASFATALAVAIPLGLSGEALGFPIGYQPWGALGLWLGSVLGLTVLALVPVWREEGASAAAAGVLMGLAMTGLQFGWIAAAGFRPGIQWALAFVVAAALVSAAGTGTAMALAFPYGDRARSYRYSWRIAAAGLIGLSFLAGYALLLYGAGLNTQIGSVYRYELPGSMISLFGGALVPIVLMLMVLDLETRRRQRRRQWRARRRGELSTMNGGDSVFSPMDAQPSRFLMQDPGYSQHYRRSSRSLPAAPPPAAAATAPPAGTGAPPPGTGVAGQPPSEPAT